MFLIILLLAQVDLGKGAFRIYCAPCHGIHGQGGRGPDLTRGPAHTDEELFRLIRDGVPGTEMPSFARVADDGIRNMVTYIRSIGGKAEAAKGDAAAGEQVYRSKGCDGCHGGARNGPDLRRIGRQRSVAFLRESVVAPEKDVAPGWALVSVTAKDGRKVTGVEKGLDNFTVQLVDQRGVFHSIEHEQMRGVTRESRSLMPKMPLTPKEVDDVVAYLAGLK